MLRNIVFIVVFIVLTTAAVTVVAASAVGVVHLGAILNARWGWEGVVIGLAATFGFCVSVAAMISDKDITIREKEGL